MIAEVEKIINFSTIGILIIGLLIWLVKLFFSRYLKETDDKYSSLEEKLNPLLIKVAVIETKLNDFYQLLSKLSIIEERIEKIKNDLNILFEKYRQLNKEKKND